MNQIDIGKFIAGCRKEKGLTQAQLAEKLNITDRAVSKWETGKCMPDSSIMLELCNILGVTVNELLSGERIEMNDYEECEFPYKSRVMGTSEPLKPLKAPYMARNPVKWGFFRLKGQEIPLKI